MKNSVKTANQLPTFGPSQMTWATSSVGLEPLGVGLEPLRLCLGLSLEAQSLGLGLESEF